MRLDLTSSLREEDEGSGVDLQGVLGHHVGLVESVAIQTLQWKLFQANVADFTFIVLSFHDRYIDF